MDQKPNSDERIIIYERHLAGEIWPAAFWKGCGTEEKASAIIRYVLLDKYGIKTYTEAQQIFNEDFINENKLNRVIKYIRKPEELLENEYCYVLWEAYPEFRPSRRKLIIKVYKEVLAGKRRFPVGYFSRGFYTQYKAEICIKYLCENILRLTPDEIAWTFAHSKGIRILEQYKIKSILYTVYGSLSDMIHNIYPELYPLLGKYQAKQDGRRKENKGGKV